MEVSASKPKPDITISLSYKEAQRLRKLLRDHECNDLDVGGSADKRLGRALEVAGVTLP